jgi:hypothetical protein
LSSALHKKLARALRQQGDLFDLEDILADIDNGKKQSFYSNDTWVVTSVHDYPKGRILFVELIVGTIQDHEEINKQLHDFAREHGCKFIDGFGRGGWVDLLTKLGWDAIGVHFRKEV